MQDELARLDLVARDAQRLKMDLDAQLVRLRFVEGSGPWEEIDADYSALVELIEHELNVEV